MQLLILTLIFIIYLNPCSCGGDSPKFVLRQPLSDCADSLWPGQCFTKDMNIYSCNGNWRLCFSPVGIHLIQYHPEYTFRVVTLEDCSNPICLTETGYFSYRNCNGLIFEMSNVSRVFLDDDGNFVFISKDGTVIDKYPPSLWKKVKAIKKML